MKELRKINIYLPRYQGCGSCVPLMKTVSPEPESSSGLVVESQQISAHEFSVSCQ